MSETIVSKAPVTDAAVALLSGELAFSVGDNQAPADRTPLFPYCVVYSLDDTARGGPQSDGQADAVHTIQVTSVGETRDQAQRLSDLVLAAIKATTAPPNPAPKFAVAGRAVLLVDELENGGVVRDDEYQPPLFYTVQIFGITTTPA